MKTKKTLLFIICCAAGLSASAQVKLSLNPAKGAKYQYRTEMVQNITQTVMGQTIPMEQEMTFVYDMNIKEKDSQVIEAEFIYREVYYLLSSAMMKMAYDSKNPVENMSETDKMMAKIFGVLIGKPFNVSFTADGSVLSVSGMDTIMEDVVKAVADDGQIASQIVSALQQQFGNEPIGKSFEQSFKIYPDRKIKVGDSWETQQTVVISGMTTETKSTYTLKSLKKNVASAEVVSSMVLKPIGMEGTIAGEQTGTMEIDVKTGLPLTGNITQNIKGTLTTQGVEVSMNISSQIKTSTSEIK
jgi:hypothetical protein